MYPNLAGDKPTTITNQVPISNTNTILTTQKSPTITTIGASSIPSSSQKISMNNFLEFLKITCHVNDSIMYSSDNEPSPSSNGKHQHEQHQLNYNQLANNELINQLLGNHFKETVYEGISKNHHDGDNNNKCNNNNSLHATTSKRFTTLSVPMTKSKVEMKRGLHPILKNQLDEVINEGILDSVLPFICPVSVYSSNYNNSNSISQATSLNALKGCKQQLKGRGESSCSNSNVRTITTSNIQTFNNHNNGTSFMDKDATNSDILSELALSDKFNSTRLNSGSVKIKDITHSKGARRKSIALSQTAVNTTIDDKKRDKSEVIIHVCDEVKNTSRDFHCPQSLLVSKMGYFADVTAGQKLEDMDISVHCDIQIFDWLMKWVKKDYNQHIVVQAPGQETVPQLDPSNVVPILVSASFLQMEPLLLDCLSFCHARMNDIVRSSTNLSCLNDVIISRLAAMFTNLELEMVRDKRERITPRLWTKLITSLFEPEAEVLRGHYFSLGGIFRCLKCGKLLTQSVFPYVNCVSSNMRLNRWGQLISQHVRDNSWDVTSYVSILFKELKSWRKVYWKLWGHCHFLYCCICETHFPAYQMNWCQFHPESPQFLGPLTEGHIAGPAGRYPCCGQQAFRFETLPGPNGCQYREHSVLVESDRDRAILVLAQLSAEGGCLIENPPIKLHQNSNYNNYEPRWLGMCLMPTKCRQGLLPALHIDEFNNNKLQRRATRSVSQYVESSSETESSETFPERTSKICQQFSITSSEGCESETSSPRNYRSSSKSRRNKASGRYWCGEFSARSNQDNQRDFEEKVMKQVVSMIGKKNGTDTKQSIQNSCNGGTYVKLEAEWKDHVKHRNINNYKTKSK